MENDTLKSINDRIKRLNGTLIKENEALKKEIDSLKEKQLVSEKGFDSVNRKNQDLMFRHDALFDNNEALKRENKELTKVNEYLKTIIDTLQKESKSAGKKSIPINREEEVVKLVGKIIRENLTGNNSNPVYNRLTGIIAIFFENKDVSAEMIKKRYNISRATFARDIKHLKDLRYIILKNSKKEGIYCLTKEGKKLKKQINKALKRK